LRKPDTFIASGPAPISSIPYLPITPTHVSHTNLPGALDVTECKGLRIALRNIPAKFGVHSPGRLREKFDAKRYLKNDIEERYVLDAAFDGASFNNPRKFQNQEIELIRRTSVKFTVTTMFHFMMTKTKLAIL
jgi:hypothetical protein